MRREELFPATEVRRKPPVNANDSGGDLSFLRLEDRCPACDLCEVRHAFVSPFGMVFHNGRVVRESLHPFYVHGHNAGTFYKKILLGRFRRVRDRCVAMHNPLYNNYYHWTVEALPRLFAARDRSRGARVLLGEETQPFHAQTLDLFDTGGIEPIPRAGLVFADDVLLPTHTGAFPTCNEALVAQMGAWLRERVGPGPEPAPTARNLYLMRGADKDRRLINEDDVVALLSGLGFRAVRTEGLSVPQQIRLFAGARNLVAVHGAGLSNLIYMPPGGFALTLINEHHRDASFFNLACALKHDVALLQCRTHGTIHRKAARYDMIADLGALERLVRTYMK